MLQYGSALANLNQAMSPSVFPQPFNDRSIERPIPLPIYKEFGDPISRINPNGEDPPTVPTEWAFYLGFIISSLQLYQLWIDMLAIIIMNYFFLYFHSASYELDMNVNIHETAIKACIKFRKSLSKSDKFRNNGFETSINDSFQRNKTNKNSINKSEFSDEEFEPPSYFQMHKYIKKIKGEMPLVRVYEGISMTI